MSHLLSFLFLSLSSSFSLFLRLALYLYLFVHLCIFHGVTLSIHHTLLHIFLFPLSSCTSSAFLLLCHPPLLFLYLSISLSLSLVFYTIPLSLLLSASLFLTRSSNLPFSLQFVQEMAVLRGCYANCLQPGWCAAGSVIMTLLSQG